MKGFVGAIFTIIILIVLFGIIGNVMSSGDDGYCEEETQFVDDDSWSTLCE